LKGLKRGADETAATSLALNLGTGREHSVLEIVQAAQIATGRPVRRSMQPRRASRSASLDSRSSEGSKRPEMDCNAQSSRHYFQRVGMDGEVFSKASSVKFGATGSEHGNSLSGQRFELAVS
jgi:nucleoside-diphosphate-sugar epimerase